MTCRVWLHNRFKRFKRSEKPPMRAVKVLYLGIFPNKVTSRHYHLPLALEHPLPHGCHAD